MINAVKLTKTPNKLPTIKYPTNFKTYLLFREYLSKNVNPKYI